MMMCVLYVLKNKIWITNLNLQQHSLYLLKQDKNYLKLQKNQEKILIQKAHEFAQKCFDKLSELQSITNLLQVNNYEIETQTQKLQNFKNYYLKASLITNSSSKKIILYEDCINKICNIAKQNSININYNQIKEILLAHECFHIIEMEYFNDQLINNNRVQSKKLWINSNYKLMNLSEISANYFSMLVTKSLIHPQILDFLLLIELNIITEKELKLYFINEDIIKE